MIHYGDIGCNLNGEFSSFVCTSIAHDFVLLYLDKNNDFLKDYFINKAKKYFEIGCKQDNNASCRIAEDIKNGVYEKNLKENLAE